MGEKLGVTCKEGNTVKIFEGDVTNTATKTDSLVKRKGKGKVFPLQA
jgi:hypothetical protein